MAIALYHPTDGFNDYERFAYIADGEVVKGSYVPPPNVDLADEEALVARYNGPGVVATRVDCETATSGEGREAESGTGQPSRETTPTQIYSCTMCETRVDFSEPETARDNRRWMPCPACETDRFFQHTATKDE